MATRKARIRGAVRAARADRRQGARRTSTDSGHLDPADPDGMLAAWRSLLPELGLASPSGGPADRLPALFVPTAQEPDVRPIVDAEPRSLLPVLVTPAGVPLPTPAWGTHEGGSGELTHPHPRRPAQPAGPVLPPQALADAAIVLVAALAVDLSGTRLGQGGGWYDRALLHLRPGTPVVAAVFDEEVLPAESLPREPHDRPVDAVITPSRTILIHPGGPGGTDRR